MTFIGKIKSNSTIFSNMASLSLLQMANYVIPLIVIPFVTRALGVEMIGKVSYAQNIILYFTLIITYGFDYSATKEISIHRNNKEKTRSIFWNVIWCKIILFGISFLLFSILALFFGKIQHDFKLYFCVFIINIGYTFFPTWFFQGMEDMKTMAIVNFLIKLFGTGLSVFFICSPQDYLIYAGMPSLSYAIFGFLSFFFTIKHYNLNKPEYDWNEIKTQICKGFPIFLNTLFTTLYTIANLTILGFFTNEYEIGIYSGAHKIITAIMMMTSMPINLAIFPSIARKRNESKKAGWSYLKKMLLYIFLASLVISIASYILAPLLVKILLGNEFTECIPLLKIFSILPTLVIMSSMFTVQGLYGMGLEKYAPFVGLILGTSCILLNIKIIPIYGIYGAAIAWIIMQILEILLSGSITFFHAKKWQHDK